MTWLDTLAEKALARELPTRAEALGVLKSTDDELMDVVAAAFQVRLRYFGRRVKLNYLVNIKSGLCPEDCFYCSQRLGSAADVLKYTWLKPDEVMQSAEAGVKAGAKRVCLVASGRGPTDADITRVSTAIKEFKARNPGRRGLRLPRPARRRPGRAPARGRHHRLQPQPEHGRNQLHRHLHHPLLRRPRRHGAKSQGRRPVPVLGPDRRDGRERRGADRRGVRAARTGPRLGAGQLPDPVRGHPAGRRVEPHPAALPAHPGHGPVRLPGRRGPAGRRPRDPPAQPAAARAAHRQLDLPRRLPDQRGPARRTATWR